MLFKVALLVISIIATSHAWVASIPAPARHASMDADGNVEYDNPPEKCVLKDYDNFEIKLGEEVKIPDTCVLAECHGDGSVSLRGCSKVMIPDGCTFKKPDLTLEYPKCCEDDYDCPEGTGGQ